MKKMLILSMVLAAVVTACAANESVSTQVPTQVPTQTAAEATVAVTTEQSSTTANVKIAHVKNVTAITEVFGDGQKVTAVAAEYDQVINNAGLSTSAFSVEGRTITKVYANTAPARAAQGVNGKYVIIELSTDDASASTLAHSGAGPESKTIRNEVKVLVTQLGEITTAAGAKYAPTAQAIVNDKEINPVVDDFKQLEYQDPKTGITLKYNLYIPQNYDKNKPYPLVLFIHDAGTVSDDPRITLMQGLGAVVWATPEEQAKHKSFVLAPQYASPTVNDQSEATQKLDVTVDLINALTGQYNIDKSRIYTTGQSMGCMSSIALMIKYPDLFAAALLVAGQWDATKVAPLAQDKLWIIVSEGDLKAFPGMNAITAALEQEGAKVSRATWSGLSTPAEFAAEVSKMMAENTNINYTVLQKGTVVPAGQTDDGGSNHINTWRIAYTIEGARDWLFKQVKTTN